jgi:hypothetical protein
VGGDSHRRCAFRAVREPKEEKKDEDGAEAEALSGALLARAEAEAEEEEAAKELSVLSSNKSEVMGWTMGTARAQTK